MPSVEKLAEFVTWAQHYVTGDEKGQAQIFLDRLFQAFGLPGALDVGGHTEFRIRKAGEDGGGTAFADYVWKPVVLVEMKKRHSFGAHFTHPADTMKIVGPTTPAFHGQPMMATSPYPAGRKKVGKPVPGLV